MRYRGYVCDTETRLYYLQSRYYDPEICRFINADGYASTGQGLLGGNAFAYCLNCPVMGYDPSGCRPIWEHDYGKGVIGYTDTGTRKSKTINGQKLPQFANIPYLISTIGFSGCEAIAVYNALVLTGHEVSFNDVKHSFEEVFKYGGGIGLRGLAGAAPIDILIVLSKYNIRYKELFSIEEFTSINTRGVFILSYWNKPFYYGIHTVAIAYDGEQYTVFNYYMKSRQSIVISDINEIVFGELRYVHAFFISY